MGPFSLFEDTNIFWYIGVAPTSQDHGLFILLLLECTSFRMVISDIKHLSYSTKAAKVL